MMMMVMDALTEVSFYSFCLFVLDRLLVCFLTKTLGQEPSSGLALPW